MKCRVFLIILTFILASCSYNNKPKFRNDSEALSYYLGVFHGLMLKEAGYTKFDKDLFDNALRREFNQKNLDKNLFHKADMIIYNYKISGIEKQNKITLEAGKKFLADNKLRKDIITTQSGLQYNVIKMGSGPNINLSDSVIVKFKGSTLDGTEFISSDSYTQPFEILQTIKGCKEVLQLMKEGSHYKVYLPTELSYWNKSIPGTKVKPYMVVVFDIIIIHNINHDPKYLHKN